MACHLQPRSLIMYLSSKWLLIIIPPPPRAPNSTRMYPRSRPRASWHSQRMQRRRLLPLLRPRKSSLTTFLSSRSGSSKKRQPLEPVLKNRFQQRPHRQLQLQQRSSLQQQQTRNQPPLLVLPPLFQPRLKLPIYARS